MNKNRPLLLILLLLFLPVLGLQAQEFNAGIFGGLNGSQVDRDGYGGYNKFSLNAGAFVNREFAANFFWQLEIKYGGRGVYHRGADITTEFFRSSYQYIELPLSVHYLHEGKYQAEIGISPDVLIKVAGSHDPQYPAPIEGIGEYNRFGINILAGVGYWFHPNVGVNLRFTYSVIPFTPMNPAAVRYWYSGWFHNVLSLSAVYKIFHPK